MDGHISKIVEISAHLPTDLLTDTLRKYIFIDTTTKWLFRPLTTRTVRMAPPVDLRKVVGYTVHAKAIHVMDESEWNRLYGSQKKVRMAEGVVIDVDLQITKQRRKEFYVISD